MVTNITNYNKLPHLDQIMNNIPQNGIVNTPVNIKPSNLNITSNSYKDVLMKAECPNISDAISPLM